MTKQHHHVLGLLLTCLVAAGCGGSSGASGPLKLRLSERYIAGVPISEHGDVINAEDDVSLAHREYTRAKLEYEQSDTSRKVARYGLQQAELATKAARTKLRAAKSRANLHEIRAAEKDLTIAIAEQEAARARYQEMMANRAYLKAELDYRIAHERAMEARFEFEKARLAAAHDIYPQGFSLADYQHQFNRRMELARSAEVAASQKRTAATVAHRRWVSLNDRANRSQRREGPPGAFPIPEEAPRPEPFAEELAPPIDPYQETPPGAPDQDAGPLQ